MSKLQIILSYYAKQRLADIYEYIKKDSPQSAKKVRKNILELIGTFNDFPEKYPRDLFINPAKGNYRFALIYSYKIVYKITNENIIVVDIFHTSQNPGKINFDSER